MSRAEKIGTRVLIVLFCLRLVPFLNERLLSLRNAELWAEDATEFFSEAVVYGARTIFEPAAASLFLFSRLAAYVCAQLPLNLTPYLYGIIACIVYTATAFYIVKESFSWLIPSRQVRILFAFFIFTVNGTSEIFGTLVCLPYVFGWLAALTLLENPPLRKWPFISIWIVCALSSNLIPCLLPLAIIRSLRLRGYVWVSVFSCVLSLLLHLLIASGTKIMASQPKAIPLAVAFDYVLLHYIPMGLFTPVFGLIPASNSLYSAEIFLLLFLMLLIPMIVYRRQLFNLRSEIVRVLLGLQCSVIFFIFIHAFARAYMYSTIPQWVGLAKLFSPENFFYTTLLSNSRHSWLPGLATFLAMIVVLSRIYSGAKTANQRLRLKLAGAIVTANALMFVPPANLRPISWKEFEKTISVLTDSVPPGHAKSTHELVVGPMLVQGPWGAVVFHRFGDQLTYSVKGGNFSVEGGK